MAEAGNEQSTNATTCASCGSRNVRRIGAIPPNNNFAGRQLDYELPGGSLWRCNSCHLMFRSPRLSKEKLDRLYRLGSVDSWGTPEEQRPDWLLIREWLAIYQKTGRLLDIGCFDGRLLEFLGNNYDRLGIEINDQAAQRARAKGISIVGHDFAALSSLDNLVDVAIAVDVIEHTEDPLAFLQAAINCVRPGGHVAIASGDTDAPSWRLLASRYWYCHVAEHISFINTRWAKEAARRLGLEVQYLRRFSHADGQQSLIRRYREASLNLLLFLAPSVFRWLRHMGMGGIDVIKFPGMALAPPYWFSARDHLLVVFRKPNNRG